MGTATAIIESPVKVKQKPRIKNKSSKRLINTIINESCITGMNKMKDGSVNLIVTDPPFGIKFNNMGGQYNRKASNVIPGYNEIKEEDYFDFTCSWLSECERVLDVEGSMFIVSGWTNLRDILNAVAETKLQMINHLIWKYQFGVFTKKKFVTSHYHILFLTKHKSKYKFNKLDHYPEDVLVINREYWANKEKTPTRLPEKLVCKLIGYGSDEDDLVFDPFMGSGTTAVCAKNLKRNYIGFEIVDKYVDFANKRIDESCDMLNSK